MLQVSKTDFASSKTNVLGPIGCLVVLETLKYPLEKKIPDCQVILERLEMSESQNVNNRNRKKLKASFFVLFT